MAWQEETEALRVALLGRSSSIGELLEAVESSPDGSLLDALTDGATWSSRFAPTRVAHAAACNSVCPPEVLHRLSRHPDVRVRAAVAEHRSAPATLVDVLRHDPIEAVRVAARGAYGAALWRDAPRDITEHPSADGLRALASRWTMSPEEFFLTGSTVIVV